MTVGMAGVAGTILAAYAGVLGPDYLPYLLAAAFMSAPGGILMAKIIMPDEAARPAGRRGEIELPKGRISAEGPAALTEGGERRTKSRSPKPSRTACARPTSSRPPRRARRPGSSWRSRSARCCSPSSRWWRWPTGCSAASGDLVGLPDLTFQRLLGYRVRAGDVSARHSVERGAGRRRAVRHQGGAQRIRRLHRPQRAARRGTLSDRSRAIVTFALCGFANFSSIAIQMAVTGGLAPNQRPVIARLGLRALAAGFARQPDERGARRAVPAGLESGHVRYRFRLARPPAPEVADELGESFARIRLRGGPRPRHPATS